MAAEPADEDTIYVWGRREVGIGSAQSASEGLVSFGAFVDRPMLRTGEIAEVIPGVAVTQHSGSGKANQYFLRGFNLDHGTDFSVALNGVPLNLRTHAHGQGYLDLGILIPELIDNVLYRKGPYFADTGDFSAAGSAEFSLFRRLPADFVMVTAGQFGHGRVLGARSLGPEGYLALDVTLSDGPWLRDEDLRKFNAVFQQSVGEWSLTAMGYRAQWNATDQVPLRAVQSGALPLFGTLDPTDGGRTSRFIATARREADDGVTANAYLQQYEVDLWSNFTYFLDDPERGDQFRQSERRWTAGGATSKSWQSGSDLTYQIGAEARYDRIGRIGLYRTQQRDPLSTDREDSVDQASGGLYAQGHWTRSQWRATFGVRYDAMTVEVDSSRAADSGSATAGILSPKATLAYRASDSVELYADVGRGFHSNDARGATAGTDPVDLYAQGTGEEVGIRFERPGFTASFALWALRLDSELVYTGDAGDTESANASRRLGGEVLMNWTPVRRVNIDLSAAATRARYEDTAPGEDHIPNALRYVLTGGVSVQLSARSSAEVTLRRLGPSPLNEDGTAQSSTSTLTNLLYRLNFGRASIFGELLNVFDRADADITYFYASRLPGEPLQGVDDIHFHPMEPRTVRVGVRWTL